MSKYLLHVAGLAETCSTAGLHPQLDKAPPSRSRRGLLVPCLCQLDGPHRISSTSSLEPFDVQFTKFQDQPRILAVRIYLDEYANNTLIAVTICTSDRQLARYCLHLFGILGTLFSPSCGMREPSWRPSLHSSPPLAVVDMYVCRPMIGKSSRPGCLHAS